MMEKEGSIQTPVFSRRSNFKNIEYELANTLKEIRESNEL